jgi:hypothetical protein
VPVAERESTSPVGFWAVVVVVLVICGYLGWQVYDSPVDPDRAGLVATQATEVAVRAGGGNTSVCETMRDVAARDEADEVVRRCTEIASNAATSGVGWLGVRNLHASEVDVGRRSGTVTVSGTLLTPGPTFGLTFIWPVTRDDDRWTVSGGPEVDVQ